MPIEDFYINDYTIYTNSGSIDANGDYTEAATAGSTGKCKLQAVSGQRLIRNTDKGEVWADYRAYMAPVTIDEFDNITIDSNEYQIIFVASRLDEHLEVDLLRIT